MPAPRPAPGLHETRYHVAVGVAALVPLVVAGLALTPPASAGRPTGVDLVPIGSYAGGGFGEAAAEIPAFDPDTDRLFVVNAERGTVDVLDASDPTALAKVGELDTPGANSVDIRDGVLAVAAAAPVPQDPGTVAFVDTTSLAVLGRVRVGALPDMLTYTPDGRRVVVANEGEPSGYEAGDVDPEGSVSVIDVSGGVPDQADVRTAGFGAFDARRGELVAAGVRLNGPGASVAQDLEPEYVAVDRTSRTAWVTLQEANALAVVDLRRAEVTDVLPLGLKDHSLTGQGLDASDRDGGTNIRTWPVRGLYMPDAVDAYTHRGRTYLVTANEGDARDYDGFGDEARVSSLQLSPDAFPGVDLAGLQAPGQLGRLTVSTSAPRDAAGRYTELHAFGARSFSIWDDRGRLVFDSGDELEQVTAALLPDAFNSDNAENASADTRSDNKGPEPEGVALGQVAGRTYAFVGLERVGGIAVYDVTRPEESAYVSYVNPRDFEGRLADNGSDSGPEGLVFVPAGDSPTSGPLLVVGNEVSGTTTVYAVQRR